VRGKWIVSETWALYSSPYTKVREKTKAITWDLNAPLICGLPL